MNLPERLLPLMRLRKVLIGRDFYLRRDIKLPVKTLGHTHADWTFQRDLLDAESIVYSCGVGKDISFDLGLIKEFNLKVYAFDPTPDSAAWVNGQDLPDGFQFVPIGVADYNGRGRFFPPPAGGSYSLLDQVYETPPIDVEVKRLQTIMSDLGHDRIDLLKMDIEGAEFSVLDDILDSDVPITQLLVEFHHRFEGIGIEKSKQAIRKLKNRGYKVFHVSRSGEEISFTRSY